MINLEFENKKLQLLINKLNEKLKSDQISFREQQPSTFGQQVNKTPSITPTVITANSYEALGNQDDDIYSNTQEYIAQLTQRQKQKQHYTNLQQQQQLQQQEQIKTLKIQKQKQQKDQLQQQSKQQQQNQQQQQPQKKQQLKQQQQNQQHQQPQQQQQQQHQQQQQQVQRQQNKHHRPPKIVAFKINNKSILLRVLPIWQFSCQIWQFLIGFSRWQIF